MATSKLGDETATRQADLPRKRRRQVPKTQCFGGEITRRGNLLGACDSALELLDLLPGSLFQFLVAESRREDLLFHVVIIFETGLVSLIQFGEPRRVEEIPIALAGLIESRRFGSMLRGLSEVADRSIR